MAVYGKRSEESLLRARDEARGSLLTWFRDDGVFGERRIFWSHASSGARDELHRVPCGNFGESWEHVRYLIECELYVHGEHARRNPWLFFSDRKSTSALSGQVVAGGSYDEATHFWRVESKAPLKPEDMLSPGSHVVVRLVSKPRCYPTYVPGRFRHDVFRKWDDFLEAQHASRWKDVVLDLAAQDPSLVPADVTHRLQQESDNIDRECGLALSVAEHSCKFPGRLLSQPASIPHWCDRRADAVPPNFVCEHCQRHGHHLSEFCPTIVQGLEDEAESPPSAEAPAASAAPEALELDDDILVDLFSTLNIDSSA